MGIRNYLIEGGSGTGKTTVAEELKRRGTSAVIKAFSADKFNTVAAFHRPTFTTVNTDDADALEGVRDGYEIRILREMSIYENAPYKNRTTIQYYINPEKTLK